MLELNKIYCMDCLDGMKLLDSESIDLVVTSPPYNVGKEYETMLSEEQYEEFVANVFVEIERVLKIDGRICWNVPYQMYTKRMTHEISQWHISTNALINVGLRLRDNITWNQLNSDNDTAWGSWRSASSPWLRHQTEAIIVAYKKQWKKNSKGESTITGKEFMKYVLDLWSFPCARREGHPAPFPIELPSRCLKLFSYEGDVILDPFIGSGTTAVACKQLNRKYIGFEISPEYCKIAEKRLAQETLTSFNDNGI